MGYNPNEPRDKDGQWTSGGTNGKRVVKDQYGNITSPSGEYHPMARMMSKDPKVRADQKKSTRLTPTLLSDSVRPFILSTKGNLRLGLSMPIRTEDISFTPKTGNKFSTLVMFIRQRECTEAPPRGPSPSCGRMPDASTQKQI